MARYRKIDTRVWGDTRFKRLSPIPPCGQGVWFYLLTNPETTNIPGLYRAGEMGLAEGIGWPLEAFREAFAEAFAEGLVESDWNHRVVWIKNAINYDPPASPNSVLSWRSQWDEIPECELKLRAFFWLKNYFETRAAASESAEKKRSKSKRKVNSKAFLEAFLEACPKPSVMPSGKPSPKGGGILPVSLGRRVPPQEQEQEQEQEQTTQGGASSPKIWTPGDPISSVGDLEALASDAGWQAGSIRLTDRKLCRELCPILPDDIAYARAETDKIPRERPVAYFLGVVAGQRREANAPKRPRAAKPNQAVEENYPEYMWRQVDPRTGKLEPYNPIVGKFESDIEAEKSAGGQA